MVSVGKTNMSEFAFSGLGVNTVFGTPMNPAHTDCPRAPGGSSSGAAVSVALGVAPYAIGTDTSGSTRLPAAWCGVVGYRASKNRHGANDFQPLSQTLDCVGVVARTVRDIRLVDEVMLKRHPTGRYLPDSSVPHFVVPDGELIEECQPGIASAFADVVSALSAAGATIEHRVFASLDDAQSLMDSCGTIVGAEAVANICNEVHDGRLLQAATVRRLNASVRANTVPAQLYSRLPELRRYFHFELGDAILLCPTVRIPPPPISELGGNAKAFDDINKTALRSTMLTSYLGACSVSYPAQQFASASGLMMSCPWGDDDRLLAAADFVESADVRNRPPFG
jgi:aspartyl-tRNA(Asn)/glutamyl-tRNA(Gln) amidotransferase subunit A